MTRTFLEFCDPTVRDIFHYWDRQRAGKPMPCRADVDPLDIPQHLPYLLLIDVVQEEPPRFIYRVVGTAEVEVRGRDPTGREVGDEWFGASREEVLADYEWVCANRSFMFDPRPFVTPDRRFRQDEMLFLPLSETGVAVTQIIVYARTRRVD